jgi:DNA-binding NarL/FixJ family response regulator
VRLSPLEHAVVTRVQLGHSNKHIAFDLGLQIGTISATLSSAMRKVGVSSRVELISRDGLLTEETIERVLAPQATRAEIGVAILATAGLSNAEIATRRGVSVRTVANQLARLFDRVSVGSRAELAAWLKARVSAPAEQPPEEVRAAA